MLLNHLSISFSLFFYFPTIVGSPSISLTSFNTGSASDFSILYATPNSKVFLAFRMTGWSTIFPSNSQAPRFSPATSLMYCCSNLVACWTLSVDGENASWITGIWFGWIVCFPVNPNDAPCSHSARRVSKSLKLVETYGTSQHSHLRWCYQVESL